MSRAEKFSEGEWVFGIVSVYSKKSSGELVALATIEEESEPEEITEANGRLMAAAPDLYAAVTAFLDLGMRSAKASPLGRATALAKAAIEKTEKLA